MIILKLALNISFHVVNHAVITHNINDYFDDRLFNRFLAHLNDFYYSSSTIKSLPCPLQNRFAYTVSQY